MYAQNKVQKNSLGSTPAPLAIDVLHVCVSVSVGVGVSVSVGASVCIDKHAETNGLLKRQPSVRCHSLQYMG